MTVSLPSRDRAVADRRARNHRIRQLRDQGWSNARIAAEVGLSDEGVRKILASAPSPEEVLEAAIREREIELKHLKLALDGHRDRSRRLRRELTRLQSEREARQIDRLLDLA